MPDFKKEWLEKADIDYFAPFVNLWLACNSWYKSHYSDINGTDRDFINRIKTDFTGRNHLYTKFRKTVDNQSKEGIYFRANLELLHYSLERTQLKPEKTSERPRLLFRSAVIDYNNPSQTKNLIITPKINQDGSVHASDAPTVIKLDSIFISSNKEEFFAGLFEIIYQVRNILVHGNLNPEKDEHNVVKCCYLILWDLMN